MDLGLKDKVIIVGGGAGGIGSVVCGVLREEGAEVVVADRTAGVDLSVPEEVSEFFHDVVVGRFYGQLDGYASLVYGGGGESSVFDTGPEEIENEIRNTLLAAVYPIQEAVKWMGQWQGGHIVVVSSVNSVLGLNEFAYDLAKGALNRITPDIAAGNLLPDGTRYGRGRIYATTLCPGTVVGTPSWEGREDDIRRIAEFVPDGRVTTAEEVARAVAFFLSDHAKMFNGATIIADRGWSLRPVFK